MGSSDPISKGVTNAMTGGDAEADGRGAAERGGVAHLLRRNFRYNVHGRKE